MNSNPRFLFTLLTVTAFALLGTLLFTLTRWSNGNHWLMWCLTTLMHFQLAVWHTAGMLLSLLFAVTILRAGLFVIASFYKNHQRSRSLEKLRIPVKLSQAMKREGIKTLNVLFTLSNEAELYCFGLLQPKIVISSAVVRLLTTQELRIALRHEEYHRLHRHTLKLWTAELASNIMWFLPLAQDVVEYLHYRTEVAADAYAAQGRAQPLLSALQKFVVAPRWQVAFAASPAEARVQSILGKKTLSFRPHIVRLVESMSVLAILLAGFMLVAAPTQATTAAALLKGAMTEHNNHCPQPLLFSVDR